MKISVKKYLLYSSIFAIFTELFFFNFIIDWKLFYLIVITNYILLFSIKKISVNKNFFILLAILFVHAVIVNTYIGVPYNYMLAQLTGIGILGVYYYNLLPLYNRADVVKVYTNLCLYAAVIGYLFYFLRINVNHDNRLQSIFTEPAHYAIVVIPACYYFFKEKKYLPFIIILGTLILSNSSLGYIGCALMFIIPNISWKRVGYLACLIPVIAGMFYYIYNEYDFFKMRVKETYDSLNVINSGKFNDDTNLSSYALISNLHIAKNNINDHPLGSGIGSHHYMHTKVYMPGVRPPEYIYIQDRHTINSFDANSLFIRIMSELGIIGITGILLIIILASRCYKYTDYLAQGIFIYFLLKLFRDGHYFPPELYFFIWYFYFSMKSYAQGSS